MGRGAGARLRVARSGCDQRSSQDQLPGRAHGPRPRARRLNGAERGKRAYVPLEVQPVRCRRSNASSRLVRSRKDGRLRTYTLAPERLRDAEDWLARQRNLWERRLDQLDEYVTHLKEQRPLLRLPPRARCQRLSEARRTTVGTAR